MPLRCVSGSLPGRNSLTYLTFKDLTHTHTHTSNTCISHASQAVIIHNMRQPAKGHSKFGDQLQNMHINQVCSDIDHLAAGPEKQNTLKKRKKKKTNLQFAKPLRGVCGVWCVVCCGVGWVIQPEGVCRPFQRHVFAWVYFARSARPNIN